jgi:protein MpaA
VSSPRRNYDQIIRRLAALPPQAWRVRRVSTVWGYPWFAVEHIASRYAPTVLLTAGIHGEEPATVEGALHWLEHDEWAKWRVNWLVLPCINPYGWERNQRRNAQGRDLNRQFRGSSDCPEVALVKRLVLRRRFLFLLDFHEDVDASGYYVYELQAEPPFIGERIVKAVSKVIPINRDKVIDGRQTTGLALIRSGALNPRSRWPMAYHLFLNCTTHVLGSETPVHFPLEQRATAHNVALRTALGALVRKR